jgi:thiol-disulfide isomerase/thioredoxin
VIRLLTVKYPHWFIVICLMFAGTMPSYAEEDGDRYRLRATAFDSGLPWLNVERPLTLDDLQGKVVILDFWTYGCINCVHVLEDLRRLEHRFGDKLAVIGVHTPKFDNEKNLETLRSIVVRYRIEHPVVNDVDFELGRYYGMRAWPTQVVVDPQGNVVGQVVGEGNYDVLEKAIDRLLDRHREHLDDSPLPLALESARLGDTLLAAPGKIAVSERRVAISDTLHNRIVVTDHQGNIESLFGGPDAGLRDGAADTARFASPQGLAFDAGGLYVADTGNHAIRYIDLLRGEVTTVAGGGEQEIGHQGDYVATAVRLRSPWGLAVREQSLYIAMAGNHQIWRLELESGRIADYAGSGREGLRDGALERARFSQPSGLSLHGKWLYVADAEDSAIRRIDLDNERVETLVGTGLFDFGDRDGAFDKAQLQHVLGVAAVDDSTIVVADTYNHRLKQLDLVKQQVVSLAGTGMPAREQGEARTLHLNEPGGLAVLGDRVLIADTNNNRIVDYNLQSGRAAEWVVTPQQPVPRAAR